MQHANPVLYPLKGTEIWKVDEKLKEEENVQRRRHSWE